MTYFYAIGHTHIPHLTLSRITRREELRGIYDEHRSIFSPYPIQSCAKDGTFLPCAGSATPSASLSPPNKNISTLRLRRTAHLAILTAATAIIFFHSSDAYSYVSQFIWRSIACLACGSYGIPIAYCPDPHSILFPPFIHRLSHFRNRGKRRCSTCGNWFREDSGLSSARSCEYKDESQYNPIAHTSSYARISCASRPCCASSSGHFTCTYTCFAYNWR